MSPEPSWLPPLMLFEDYGGDWSRYLEATYLVFKADFIDDWPYYRGLRVKVRLRPCHRHIEAGFWHITSEGPVEEERLPDLRRCERIRWPRPLILHADDQCVKAWTEKRQGDSRVHLWLEDVGYLVVLSVKGDSAVLVTAFPTLEDHQRRKCARRFARAQNA